MIPLLETQISLLRSAFPELVEHEQMARHTSFRTGGAARLYGVFSNPSRVIELVEAAESAQIPWSVYGGGSNLLVADEGYEGVLIQMANRGLEIQETTVRVESGMITALLARKTVEAGLTGLEWSIGVPGTVGGALYGNAGCYGGETKDYLQSVDVYDVVRKERRSIPVAECAYGYRESRFKKERFIIFGATFVLTKSPDPVASRERLEQIMRERKEKQPLDQSSAGCAFKNVEFADDAQVALLEREVTIPESMRAHHILGAGWLVDQAGLLGARVGEVEVSQKHGNFLVNKGHARAQDVVSLISLIKRKVRDEFGIELQEEVQYLGFS